MPLAPAPGLAQTPTLDSNRTSRDDGEEAPVEGMMRVLLFSTSVLAAAFQGVALSAQTLPITPAPTYELAGSVFDVARHPLPLVEVILVRDAAVVHTVLSSDNGRFNFGRLGGGPITLHFRRLGYAAQTIDVVVGPGGHPDVSEIVLVEVASPLAEIEISTEPAVDRYHGFYVRRQQRKAFGRFLEHSDVRRLGPSNPSELFRTVPGVAIRSSGLGGNTIRIRGCQPMVILDGQRVPGAELDEVIQPADIGAIEFYPSNAGVPAQYLERGNRLCGLILVWTR